MLIYVVLKNNKIVYELWHNCSIYGHNIEHNRQLVWALLKSIIGKKLSMICQGLYHVATLWKFHYIQHAQAIYSYIAKYYAHLQHPIQVRRPIFLLIQCYHQWNVGVLQLLQNLELESPQHITTPVHPYNRYLVSSPGGQEWHGNISPAHHSWHDYHTSIPALLTICSVCLILPLIWN